MSKPSNSKAPISVLIPVRDEAKNLPGCLVALRDWADEIVVADSFSTNGTAAVAESYGAKVVQFTYKGGWPKKRQAILDSFPFRNEWILLLDADEMLLPPVKEEIEAAIKTNSFDGYWLRLEMHFLGRQLRHGDSHLWKLSLFRNGKGRYETRLESQDSSMGDIEVHEHVVVDGNVGRLRNPVRHENFNTLDRYIQKHNEYSNWEAKVIHEGTSGELRATPWGGQAQRRRWLKRFLVPVPGAPIFVFFYLYFLRLGLLDGVPGLLYCGFKAIQLFHTKAKLFEITHSPPTCDKMCAPPGVGQAWAPKVPMGTLAASHVRALFNQQALSWRGKYGPRGKLSSRVERFAERVAELSPPPARILDLGCGTGDMAAAFSRMGYHVAACDIAGEMIDVAREAHTESAVEWICLSPDWRVLPFTDSSFDGIVASSVFEYLIDVQQVATELSRVLRPEGILLLTVPNPFSYVRTLEGWFRKMLSNRHLLSLVSKVRYINSYAMYLLLSRNRFSADGWHSVLRSAHFAALDARDFSTDTWRRQAKAPLILLVVKRVAAG